MSLYVRRIATQVTPRPPHQQPTVPLAGSPAPATPQPHTGNYSPPRGQSRYRGLPRTAPHLTGPARPGRGCGTAAPRGGGGTGHPSSGPRACDCPTGSAPHAPALRGTGRHLTACPSPCDPRHTPPHHSAGAGHTSAGPARRPEGRARPGPRRRGRRGSRGGRRRMVPKESTQPRLRSRRRRHADRPSAHARRRARPPAGQGGREGGRGRAGRAPGRWRRGAPREPPLAGRGARGMPGVVVSAATGRQAQGARRRERAAWARPGRGKGAAAGAGSTGGRAGRRCPGGGRG